MLKALIVGGVLLFGGMAQAATLKGSADCGFFAEQMRLTAEMRDSGTPWSEAEKWLSSAMQQAYGQPGSIVNDADDVKYIKSVVHSIWNGPLKVVSGHTLMMQVFKDCRGPSV